MSDEGNRRDASTVLGGELVARAEAIVAETWPRARVVWRVMGVQAMRRELNVAMNVALNEGNGAAGVRLVATVANFYPGELAMQLEWWEENGSPTDAAE